MRVGFLSTLVKDVEKLFHTSHSNSPPPQATPAPATPRDAFVSTNSTQAPMDLTGASSASAVGGPARSPYDVGRVHTDGRAFVGENGEPFTYRSVSEFLLPYYMTDPAMPPEQREQVVAQRMDERVQQGYSVVRVFGMVDWPGNAQLHPFDDWEGYKAGMEKMLDMAEQRGLHVEITAFTDAGRNIPPGRMDDYINFIADVAEKHPNTFIEVCNESFKNGLSEQQVYDIAKQIKARAPDVMIAGSSPQVDGVGDDARDSDGHRTDGREFADAPFDYITIHSERDDGENGFRWVRHLKEGGDIASSVNKPVVQDEPIGSAGSSQPGRRDSDPRHFVDAALVAHVTGQYFTFHNEGAVTGDPNANIPEPGQDLVHLSDLIPADPRGSHFVNGHWDESPFEARQYFDGNGVNRIYTKMMNDGSGFYSYPVDIEKDLELPVKHATHIKVVDVMTQKVLVDRDYAAGEKLHLDAHSDVVIYGGNVKVPTLAQAVPAKPKVAGSDASVPPQTANAAVPRGTAMDAAAAQALTGKLYQAILGREADPGGLAGYASMAQRGQTPAVLSSLFTSAEFTQRAANGLTRGDLALAMYGNLLGRDPTDDELAIAVGQLGMGRGVLLADELIRKAASGNTDPSTGVPAQLPAQGRNRTSAPMSGPHASALVSRLYRGVLGRDADPAGMNAYQPMLQAGKLADVVSALVTSPEFAQHATSLSSTQLANDLYQALLDRDAEPEGLAGTAEGIGAGHLADFVIAMASSPEYAQKNP